MVIKGDSGLFLLHNTTLVKVVVHKIIKMLKTTINMHMIML